MKRTATLLAALACFAQKPPELWPGAAWAPAVPTVRQVLGYDPGDRITSPAGLVRYMEALAAAEPARMKIFEYGESWEGRKLVYAAIGSESNLRRLAEIKAAMQRIADILEKERGQLWINHDKPQSESQKKAPDYYE